MIITQSGCAARIDRAKHWDVSLMHPYQAGSNKLELSIWYSENHSVELNSKIGFFFATKEHSQELIDAIVEHICEMMVIAYQTGQKYNISLDQLVTLAQERCPRLQHRDVPRC